MKIIKDIKKKFKIKNALNLKSNMMFAKNCSKRSKTIKVIK